MSGSIRPKLRKLEGLFHHPRQKQEEEAGGITGPLLHTPRGRVVRRLGGQVEEKAGQTDRDEAVRRR